MDWARLRAAVRFDSGAWRRFAELGCVYGPEWWKRGSPPGIAAVIFAIARGRRGGGVGQPPKGGGPRRGGPGAPRADFGFPGISPLLAGGPQPWGPRPPP